MRWFGRLISRRRRDTIASRETAMRMTWPALCLLLATTACMPEEPTRLPSGGVQNELPRTNPQLGGGLPLFAATVVEGGGVRGSNTRIPDVMLDVREEFGNQHVCV